MKLEFIGKKEQYWQTTNQEHKDKHGN